MCPEEVLQAQTFGIADRGRPIAEARRGKTHHNTAAVAVLSDDDDTTKTNGSSIWMTAILILHNIPEGSGKESKVGPKSLCWCLSERRRRVGVC